MRSEHQIVMSVYEAKDDMQKADDLIRDYIPFIRSEASKCISRFCTEQDDEFSIAMIAFHEAILGYEHDRGAFLSYAATLIRNRIIDFQRKEGRHQGVISLNEEIGDDEQTLMDKLLISVITLKNQQIWKLPDRKLKNCLLLWPISVSVFLM